MTFGNEGLIRVDVLANLAASLGKEQAVEQTVPVAAAAIGMESRVEDAKFLNDLGEANCLQAQARSKASRTKCGWQ